MNFLASIMAGALINTGGTPATFSNLSVAQKGKGVYSTYKGGNYCGPGWGFTYHDILDGKIRSLPKAIDAIDEACKAHDYCYSENGYFTQGCNLVLTYDLVKVVTDDNSTPQQRVDAVVMAAIFFIESQTIDLGKLANEKAVKMRNRILGSIASGGATLEQAIKKEIFARSIAI